MTEDSLILAAPGSDVFVSYASQDSAVANSIVEALERHGLKCWIAPRGSGAFAAVQVGFGFLKRGSE